MCYKTCNGRDSHFPVTAVALTVKQHGYVGKNVTGAQWRGHEGSGRCRPGRWCKGTESKLGGGEEERERRGGSEREGERVCRHIW